MNRYQHFLASLVVTAAMSVISIHSLAQTLAPEFAGDFTLTDLGSVPGVPGPNGGLFILSGQPNTLFIGGDANGPGGGLYAIDLTRDSEGKITGFSGSATQVAPAPYVDGGIGLDPGGLISYVQWPQNVYSQIDLDTGTVVNNIDLTPFGVESASSSIAFIPAGFPGAGGMRIATWSGGAYYQVDYSVGGDGLIAINSVTQVPAATLPGGPEGWAYVPTGTPQFAAPSIVLSEWSADEVSAYELDAQGDPIVASRRLFISGLDGAEGAFIDPVSGGLLFSTFGGGDRVILVEGFVATDPPPPPPPAMPVPTLSIWSWLLLIAAILALTPIARRRMR